MHIGIIVAQSAMSFPGLPQYLVLEPLLHVHRAILKTLACNGMDVTLILISQQKD